MIRVLGFNFILLTICRASQALLRKNFLFKPIFIIDSISVITAYGVGILLAFLGFGVWSLVWATLLFSLLKSLGYTSAAPIKFKIGLFFHEWKDLFSFGFGIILLRLNNYASDNGVILLLGKVLPVDLLGLFERCYRIVMLPGGYLNKVLNQVLFPTMSEIQNEDDKLFFFYQRSLGLVNSIMIPVAIFLIFFSPEIIHILLGSAWFTAIVPLQILFVILPLRISVQMGDAVIKAKGLLYRNAWRKLWYVLFLLLCVGIGGWYYGVKGAAGGVVAGMLFNYVTMLFLVKNIFTKKVSKLF